MELKRNIFALFILSVGIGLFACSGPKDVSRNSSGKEQSPADSSIYDVETFNSNFEVWYQRQNIPSEYKSLSFYESWNREYVTAWNMKCASRSANWTYEPVVGYNADEHYGFETNHKLFYYFMFVENVLKKKIIPGGPKPFFH